MENKYIPTTNYEQSYQAARARFESDPTVSQRNKELVLQFIRDAALGKTLQNRAKKRIGPSRLSKYLIHLTPLIQLFSKT